jgi:hypothetical protein
MPRESRTAKYIWRMTADPLLCGPGKTVTKILQCPLPRRNETCHCLFEINEIVDDLTDANQVELAEWFEDDIDADDVGQLMADFRRAKAGVSPLNADPEAIEPIRQRLDVWLTRFGLLQEAGAGLTGRYSDDLDV